MTHTQATASVSPCYSASLPAGDPSLSGWLSNVGTPTSEDAAATPSTICLLQLGKLRFLFNDTPRLFTHGCLFSAKGYWKDPLKTQTLRLRQAAYLPLHLPDASHTDGIHTRPQFLFAAVSQLFELALKL
ncbi:MAG TPA: hypothetical protein DEF45_15070 [Rhodopirellula sp.]|nr:hypothetical protein [Rhodopirellula sp.]